MYEEMHKKRKKRKTLAKEVCGTEDSELAKDPVPEEQKNPSDVDDALISDDDPVAERRRIFGEPDTQSDDSEGQDPQNSEKRKKDVDSDDSVGCRQEEDDDEFAIVLQAVRERKKYETDLNRPLIKEKLSQTGWKLRENFMKRSNAHLDDRDRIDVFEDG